MYFSELQRNGGGSQNLSTRVYQQNLLSGDLAQKALFVIKITLVNNYNYLLSKN